MCVGNMKYAIINPKNNNYDSKHVTVSCKSMW